MSAAPLQPGLMVIHGNRPEELSELVVQWCQRHPLHALESECVLVQSNGIAQWLKMAWASQPAAGGMGVCAAVEVSLPSQFLWRAYRAELGRSRVPEQSPLDKGPLTWRLMRLLPEFVADGQSPSLTRFLGDDAQTQGRKRFQLAERLADLYDQYQVYRADWLNDWAAGRLELADGKGGAMKMPDEQIWQARLWQLVLADVKPEDGLVPGDRPLRKAGGMSTSRAGVHQHFLRHRASGRAPVHAEDLPRRVIVFGISSLPAQTLEALSALSNTVQVLLCVHNPSMHHWSDTRPERDLWRAAYRLNPTLPAPELARRVGEAGGHPLISAWGKQGRDYIGLIDQHDQHPEAYQSRFAFNGGRIDLFTEPEPTHLLAQLQGDMLALRPLTESRELWEPIDPVQDRSIRFHRAHSAQREVEVLHDQLLARMGADPTLTPRDIVVMVPNIEDFSPHIEAVFGRIAQGDPRWIPYTVLDQSERAQHPMLLALERFMGLHEDRIRASDVLDWLDVPAVQARFGLPGAQVALLRRWIEGAGVRWGLNQVHRSQLGFDDVGELNSWHFGLRRMLLGYATGDAGIWDNVLPYDEVAGLTAVVLGPLHNFIAALEATLQVWARAAAPEVWVKRLLVLLERFFLPEEKGDIELLAKVRKMAAAWLGQCELGKFEHPLAATVVRESWMAQLDTHVLARPFLSGGVSFCSLMPMRAIPFRMICLLGMNDGDYPRKSVPAAFDLMQRDFRPGDRSRREDDRYLFLEAVLSARDALYVSWVGRDIRDNTERPPSILVGQLRDHLSSGWQVLNGHEGGVSNFNQENIGGKQDILAESLTIDHPLQPFSAVYFQPPKGGAALPASAEPGTGVSSGAGGTVSALPPHFTFAREWAPAVTLPPDWVSEVGAQAALPALQAAAPEVLRVDLSRLARFLRQPIDAFYVQRLNVRLSSAAEAVPDDERFALDGLSQWQLQDELLDPLQEAVEAMLMDPSQNTWEALLNEQLQRQELAGQLPLHGFGGLAKDQLRKALERLFHKYHKGMLNLWPERIDDTATLDWRSPDGHLLVQTTLNGLRRGADGSLAQLHLLASRLHSGDSVKLHVLVNPWVRHLAWHMARDAQGQPMAVHTVVISESGGVCFAPLSPEEAHAHWSVLLDAWREGMCAPLPVPGETAMAWVRTFAKTGDPEAADKAAKTTFEGAYKRSGEWEKSPAIRRRFASDEAMAAEWADMRQWAQRLYAPMSAQARALSSLTEEAAAPDTAVADLVMPKHATDQQGASA